MGLRAANRPIVDAEGFATGVVTKAGFNMFTRTVKHGRDDVDVEEFERFELAIQVAGTAGPIVMHVYAGSALNGILEETGRGKTKRPVYNRLSAMALSLGLTTPEELEGVIDPAVIARIQTGLENLEGDKLKFKLGKVEGRNLMVPIPDTLTRIVE